MSAPVPIIDAPKNPRRLWDHRACECADRFLSNRCRHRYSYSCSYSCSNTLAPVALISITITSMSKNMIDYLRGASVCGKFPSRRSGGGTGRHVRLRGVCRKACGFKSRPEHHSKIEFNASFATDSKQKCTTKSAKCSAGLRKVLSINGRSFLVSIRHAQHQLSTRFS